MILSFFLTAAVGISAWAYVNIIKPGKIYKESMAAPNAGNYEEGAELFKGLGDFNDAATQVNEILYQRGITMLTQGNTYEALLAFRQVDRDYRDTNALLIPLERVLDDYALRIASGDYCTIGLRDDGTVVAVGKNEYSQYILSWRDIVAVAAGGDFAVGMRADGTVSAVGEDSVYGNTINTNRWRDIVAVDFGDYNYTIGLKADGTVVAAGRNAKDYNTSDWQDIVAVDAGEGHAVGLKADGTVVSTGWNEQTQGNTKDWRLTAQACSEPLDYLDTTTSERGRFLHRYQC